MRLPSTPLNLTVFLAIVAACAVWYLLWRTKLGYEIRAVGANPEAAVYAGIKPDRIIIITMVISGGACRADGGQRNPRRAAPACARVSSGGAGFVGIAVALMGRSHPVGIVLAAMLFGLLYQGGTELSFAKPDINRDMIVVIQGLVILFMGALEYAFRPWLAALFFKAGGLTPWTSRSSPKSSPPPSAMSVPLILACLAGLWSERSGIVDIGLEGKMLVAAFAAASAAACLRFGLDRACCFAMLVSVGFALVHGYASINQRGNQVVSGVAINMLAAGLAVVLGNNGSGKAAAPRRCRRKAASCRSKFRASARLPMCPVLGCYRKIFFSAIRSSPMSPSSSCRSPPGPWRAPASA